MDRIQTIRYRGRIAATVTPTRFFPPIGCCGYRPAIPTLTFVVFMCFYAADVLNGELRGPYRDCDARLFARLALIPGELVERPVLNVEHVAAALGIPARALHAARRDARQRDAAASNR